MDVNAHYHGENSVHRGFEFLEFTYKVFLTFECPQCQTSAKRLIYLGSSGEARIPPIKWVGMSMN